MDAVQFLCTKLGKCGFCSFKTIICSAYCVVVVIICIKMIVGALSWENDCKLIIFRGDLCHWGWWDREREDRILIVLINLYK